MSDRVALMNDGGSHSSARREELYERPATRFVAEFIGESNLIEGTMETAAVFVSARELRFTVPAARGCRRGRACTLMVRPEKIALTRQSPDDRGFRGR